MSRVDEGSLAVGRVWARSLLQLASAEGREEEVLAELAAVAGAVTADENTVDFFASPLVDPESRRNALEGAFRGQLSELVVDTLQVMNRKGRLGLVTAVAEAYREELDAAAGRVEARVVSAVPLSESTRASLAAAASRWTGKAVRMREEVDPGILGGLILEVGDQKIDTSVANAVDSVRDDLLARTETEMRGERFRAAFESE